MADDMYKGSMSSEGKASVGRRMIGHMSEGFSKKESMGMEAEERNAEREKVWKRRIREMFNIKDDEEADEVWNRLGGLGGVLDKFQMVEDEEYRRNFDETRNFLEGLRNPKLRGGGQLDEIKKELEKAE